ncbi:MAG: tRNA lysidine(34) synthetase TilS [bacterium]
MPNPYLKDIPSRGRDPFLEKVVDTVRRHSMLREGDTVVVGVSGGKDSMVLLDVLCRLAEPWNLKLVVAHLDHGLRGEESGAELRFVAGQAQARGLPFRGEALSREDFAGSGSLQERARGLRYAFFEGVARHWGAQRIATGHHCDDHAETVLMQLFRGAGRLTGIPAVRAGTFIRPLLAVTRDEIEAYVRRRGLPSREDSSNRLSVYLRNRIRHELVPWIRREVNPGLAQALSRLADLQQEEDAYLDALARHAFDRIAAPASLEGDVVLARTAWGALHPVLQRRCLRLAYERLHGSSSGLSCAHLARVCTGPARPSPARQRTYCLPGGVRLFVSQEELRLSRADLREPAPYDCPFTVGQSCEIPAIGLSVRSRKIARDALTPIRSGHDEAFLDASLLEGAMKLRCFRPGDRFLPLGLGGKEKKLQDFFVDEKVPRTRRRRVPLLEVEGRIAWVVGYRISERFKITPATRECVHLEAVRSPEGAGKR